MNLIVVITVMAKGAVMAPMAKMVPNGYNGQNDCNGHNGCDCCNDYNAFLDNLDLSGRPGVLTKKVISTL